MAVANADAGEGRTHRRRVSLARLRRTRDRAPAPQQRDLNGRGDNGAARKGEKRVADRIAPLAQTFARQAVTYGARTFLRDKHQRTWRDHSWRDVAEQAMRLRAGLVRLGIRPGDRVAILSDNCPRWVVVDQAVLGLGRSVVPVYPTSGAEETRHVIADSGARLIAVNGDHLIEKALALGPALPNVEGVLAMHPDAASRDGIGPRVMKFEQVSDADPIRSIEGSRDVVATIIYTSGTTGPPKGAMLTHGNILSNCAAHRDALGLDERDSILSFLPIAHSFERTRGYYTPMTGRRTTAYAEGRAPIGAKILEI